MNKDRPKIAIIILAAGESKRMGSIKQLLPWKDSTLLENTIEQALSSKAEQVFVVLGSSKSIILEKIDASTITLIHHDDWNRGMGSSIAISFGFLNAYKIKFDAVLIVLADQPLLDYKHYNNLIDRFIDKNNIVTSSYGSKSGVPAIFGKKYFSALMALKGDKGAKLIIQDHQNECSSIDCLGQAIDLDTEAAYFKLYHKYGK